MKDQVRKQGLETPFKTALERIGIKNIESKEEIKQADESLFNLSTEQEKSYFFKSTGILYEDWSKATDFLKK